MHPTIQSVLETLPERYCTKTEFAQSLAKILRRKFNMSWKKQVFRWLNYHKSPDGWKEGGRKPKSKRSKPIVYTPHQEVLDGMEEWLRK